MMSPVYQDQRARGIQPVRTTEREKLAKEWGNGAVPMAYLPGIPSVVRSVSQAGKRTAWDDQIRSGIKEG